MKTCRTCNQTKLAAAKGAQAFIETVMEVIDDGQGNVHQNSNGH